MRAERMSDSTSWRGFIKVSFWRQRQSIVCGCGEKCSFRDVKGKADIYSEIIGADLYYSFGCTKRVLTFRFILFRRLLVAREYSVTRTNRRVMKIGGKTWLY